MNKVYFLRLIVSGGLSGASGEDKSSMGKWERTFHFLKRVDAKLAETIVEIGGSKDIRLTRDMIRKNEIQVDKGMTIMFLTPNEIREFLETGLLDPHSKAMIVLFESKSGGSL